MRVALFGGSFDPPHRGHLAIARVAADHFALDRILFAPVGRQPLKVEHAAAGFADRLAMVALACETDSRFVASSIDAPRPDQRANYTVETLSQLEAEMPGAEIFNLVGADSFHDLARWREPRRLLQLARWIVVSRPGSPLEAPAGMMLSALEKENVLPLEDVHEDVSATELRMRLESRQDCSGLLPARVMAYIEEHGLYRANRIGADRSQQLP